MRHLRSVGDLVLAFSEAKDAAVVRVLVAEDAAMGPRLRAVVVTDFEHDRRGPVEAYEALDKDAASARRLFRRLASEGKLTHLNPILVTGEVLWIEAAASERIVAAFNEFHFRLDFPHGASDEEIRELLASGMRDGWSHTIDRLVAAFAS